MRFPSKIIAIVAAASALALAGCNKSVENASADAGKFVEIRVKGSDTMVQLAAAWAEAYRKVKPNVRVNVSGGGSGTGFAALENNTIDICDASREIKAEEAVQVKATSGKEAKQFVVGYDALAMYSHPANPIEQISIDELREVWAEGGTITTWEQIDPSFKGRIVLFGRQNSSGSYDYLREHVFGLKDGKQREYRAGISELNGTAEVVANVARTPLALGYGGMGYKPPNARWLKISNKKGEPAIEPALAAARSGRYPISRKLYIYTAGEPTGELKAYIDWILSPDGQRIIEQEGYVPLK